MSEAAAAMPLRELYVRHALRDGHSVALLRVVEAADHCLVETDVWTTDGHPYAGESAASYSFPSTVEATRFVTHAVEALMALGCEIRDS